MCAASVKTSPRPSPIEDALASVGHVGFYQVYVLVAVCIPNILGAMYSLNYVFVADSVPFRCIIEECEGASGDMFNNSAVWPLLPEDEPCLRYPALDVTQPNDTCSLIDYDTTRTETCEAFLYENYDTIYAEFGLACHEWRRTLVGTVRNSALPLALILTGYISDGWGRRTAFCIFSFFAGAMGIAKSFSINYNMYLAMEFLEAALGYGFNSAAYVMVLELARPSLRAAFACATGVAYGLGGVVFAAVAWAVPSWRSLLRWIHTPALLLPLYWLLLDESPRWLYSKRRIKETEHVIKKMAVWNKITIDEQVLQKLYESNEEESVSNPEKKTNPWLTFIKSRTLMIRFALLSFCWIATTFVYYGLTINSVSLSGDKYVNFALNMSMEVVASLLLLMAVERCGRRLCIIGAFLLCGVACVIPYFVEHTATGLGLFFVGKLAITFAFNSVYVFTAEMFPTDTRSSALAACSLVGRVGSLLAPQTPLLGGAAQALVFGCTALAGALAALASPETRRTPLLDTARDAHTTRTQ